MERSSVSVRHFIHLLITGLPGRRLGHVVHGQRVWNISYLSDQGYETACRLLFIPKKERLKK